jgi:spermidine synthase
LIFSGFASLTFQVVWVRLLGQSLGSTSVSISIVLTAFFLGLALGSYLTEKITRYTISNFWPYIVLEALIGLSGLVLLPLLLNLDLLLSYAPAFGSTLSLKFLLAVLLLIVPTTCMGATFPVMAAIMIRQHKSIGSKMGQLYGFNTLGAVVGAAASGFILIPNFGLDGAVIAAVSANAAVVLFAYIVNATTALPAAENPMLPDESIGTTMLPGSQAKVQLAAAALMVTGFASIASQIGWTKYLAIFTGSTIYGFSAILATFLAGVALGSLLIERFIDRLKSPVTFVGYGLLALAAALFLARAGLSWLPDLQLFLNEADVSHQRNEHIRYTAVFVIILLPTLILGALFPVNLKVYCDGLAHVRARIGKAYALIRLRALAGRSLLGSG